MTLSLLVAIGLAGASDARAELAKWDQEKVTTVAKELAEGTVALQQGLRAKPRRSQGEMPGQRAFWSFREEDQVLVSTSRRLQRGLEGGSGMEETYPTFRRLLRTARRAERELRRLDLSEATNDKIDTVADGIRKLRPYFEPEPPL